MNLSTNKGLKEELKKLKKIQKLLEEFEGIKNGLIGSKDVVDRHIQLLELFMEEEENDLNIKHDYE